MLSSPSPVKSFARQTGDYGFLSVTDLKVLALTYDLEKQYNGVEHLKKEPTRKVCVYSLNLTFCVHVIQSILDAHGKQIQNRYM